MRILILLSLVVLLSCNKIEEKDKGEVKMKGDIRISNIDTSFKINSMSLYMIDSSGNRISPNLLGLSKEEVDSIIQKIADSNSWQEKTWYSEGIRTENER